MFVDCSECAVREVACGDCVVAVLLGYPGEPAAAPTSEPGISDRMTIEQDERRALAALADAGMVPRLRSVPAADPEPTPRSLSIRDTDVA